VAGEGPPIVLVHGFGASRTITWKNTLWIDTLARAGRRVIAMDTRGHGQSGKPHDIQSYDEGLMAGDIAAVLDGLGIGQADLMGYSMGAFLTIRLMNDSPKRIGRAVLAGLGQNYFQISPAWGETVAAALLAPDPASISDPLAKEFRVFGERAGNDLKALAACVRRPRESYAPDELALFPHKILVVCGALDTLTGPPEPLAEAFYDARALVIEKRNHHSTVGDAHYKDAVLAFLSE
jgi:pimeloyl-ACP methyl ester carboxylesterase